MPRIGMSEVLSCRTFHPVHERYKCSLVWLLGSGLQENQAPKRDITGLQSAQAHTLSRHERPDDAWPEIWIFQ